MTGPEKPFKIPGHWHWSTFQEIGEWSGGGTPSKSNESYWDGTIPWVSPKDMKRLEIRDSQDHVTEKAVEESSANLIPRKSVLFVTRSGILERTLPTAITTVDATINQDLKALSVSGEIDPKFVLYYSRAAERSILRHCAKDGTTVASLESSRLYNFPVPVPPLEEQRRIVSKTDKIFSNFDAGLAGLKTVRRQLERYRLSVLQAAVEGRLTAEWRRTQSAEPANRLLERILKERREQWEERYRWERYESKGKEPPSGWKDRYSPPDEPDVEGLGELPPDWRWVSLEQLGEWTGGNTPRKSQDEFWGGDIPWVSPKDMKKTEIFDSEDHLTDAAIRDANAKLVPPDSILFVSRSGILENSLPVAINRVQVAINQDLKALRLTSAVSSDYVLYWVLAFERQILRDCRKDGTTVASLKSDDLYTYPLALPPRPEQEEIVAVVSHHLSVAQHTVGTLEKQLGNATRLRRSILKRAFSGGLTSTR